MPQRQLLRRQWDQRYAPLRDMLGELLDPTSKVASLRFLLGLTQTRLARRMGVAQSTLARIEQDEPEGRVTIRTLRKAADAMDCDVVYQLVPRGGYIDGLLRRRAEVLARRIHDRVDSTMSLEGQHVSAEEREAMIRDTVEDILHNHPKSIWEDEA